MSFAHRSRRVGALSLSLAMLAGLLFIGPARASSEVLPGAYIDPPVLQADGPVSALVHVRPAYSLEEGLQAAKTSGLRTGTTYGSIKVFVAYGTPQMFQAVAGSEAIEAIEANMRVQHLTNTSHTATRGQAVLDGAVTLPDGSKIDGKGIGVAVVDSGIDGTHPDLASRMGGNVKVVCSTPQFVASGVLGGFRTCLGPKEFVEADDTDTISAGGHGTHVAGTVAGTGAASAGKYHGAAPGATLYGISVGTVISVENGLDGLKWVLDNHDKVSPAIKVVNNSWGSGYRKYAANGDVLYSATWKLQEDLIKAGVSVVFAAGNDAGNGSAPTTSAECINPTPGLVCVANYDDKNTGTRAGSISSSSSRGKANEPENWPDLAAPGTSIISTCRWTLPVCHGNGGLVTNPPNLYSSMSGTSMAAPHVAGIIAQLYQADPTLTPADVEDILEDTAHKFVWGSGYGLHTDPTNPDDTSSFEKGHGLVDVLAALEEVVGGSNPDADGDAVPDETDNCPATSNPGQEDGDGDGVGDACETVIDPTESPSATPTSTPSGDAAPGATMYLHSDLTGSNQADWAVGANTFDGKFPVNSEAVSVDVPVARGGPTDGVWSGTIGGTIRSLKVDFWYEAATSAAATPSLDLTIESGTTQLGSPITIALPATQVPTRFTRTFQDLNIPAGAGKVGIRFASVNALSPVQMIYDSADFPSGFSVNGGGTQATASPSPTASSSTPPTEGVIFEGEGRIATSNPASLAVGSITQNEFVFWCDPELTLSQGLDGYVFELPETISGGATATLVGSESPIGHDLDMYFYDEECESLGAKNTEAADETSEVPQGTRYIIANAWSGLDTLATLTVRAGVVVDPTTSASPSATPSSTPTSDPTTAPARRGTFPETPDDEYFGDQWGMDKINAPQAWQERRATGHGITIAINDSGVDLSHPDFACAGKLQVLPGSDVGDNDDNPSPVDPVNDGHGTHVAGIAGACTNNGEGVVGVAPDATIMPVRTLGSDDLDTSMAESIVFATDNGAHVINLSIGDIPPFSHLGPDGYPETEEALDYARSKGVVIAAAAGNFAQPTCEYPSLSRNVICVVATDKNDERTDYSDLAVNVDRNADEPGLEPVVAAPGGSGFKGQGEWFVTDDCTLDIVSTYWGNEAAHGVCSPEEGYDFLQGTSMAAPHVAGIAALLYDRIGGVRSEANADRIVQTIVDTAEDLYTPGYDPLVGYGRVDALRAVQALDPVESPTTLTLTDASASSGQYSDDVTFQALLRDEDYDVPIEGREVHFELTGASGSETWKTVTDGEGKATIVKKLSLAPGSYQLTARFEGVAKNFAGSADTAAFVLEKEDSDTMLSVEGDVPRTLTVVLADRDDHQSTLANRDVEFFADGTSIGIVSTDDTGTARMNAPAPYDTGRRTFTASFAGDAHYNPSSSEPFSTGLQSTTLTFTETSATSGQHSDAVVFEALLVDQAGAPMVARNVTFELVGGSATESWTVATDTNGVASRSVTLTQPADSYQVTARFDGEEGVHDGSADTGAFVISKEDTKLVLAVGSKAKTRTLTATLTDPDSGTPLAGKTIVFLIDGSRAGSAVTGADGVARFEAPAGKKSTTYEARFEGDDNYSSSTSG